jgi:hypothetical protein
MNNREQDRADFEQFIKTKTAFKLDRNSEGDYIEVSLLWLVWQAARAGQGEAVAWVKPGDTSFSDVITDKWKRAVLKTDQNNRWVNRKDAAEYSVPLYNSPPAVEQAAQSEVEKLENKLRAMHAAFHVSMMRAYPGTTHEEISAAISAALSQQNGEG